LGAAEEGGEMTTIRIFAFALNLLLLFTTGVFIVQRGTRWDELPIILLMTAAPLSKHVCDSRNESAQDLTQAARTCA
jgi:hypothetical protein